MNSINYNRQVTMVC